MRLVEVYVEELGNDLIFSARQPGQELFNQVQVSKLFLESKVIDERVCAALGLSIVSTLKAAGGLHVQRP